MTKKEPCKFGSKCYRKNADHLKEYTHDDSLFEANDSILDESTSEPNLLETTQDKRDNLADDVKMVAKNDDKSKTNLIEKIEKFDLSEIKDIKELVLEQNRMQMPNDFYTFYEFCQSINSNDPKNALSLINIELAGLYDLIISGAKHDYRTHSRYFFDPPEFQTVLKVNCPSMLHFGYFRDIPNEMPCCVVINEAKIDGRIVPKGDNLFAALNWYLDELITGRTYKCDANLDDLKNLKKQFTKWFDEHYHDDKLLTLNIKTPKIKSREKKTNCKTFNQFGIVVPVDSNGFGYREVPETYEAQKKMFTNYCNKDSNESTKKAKADEKIQEIITLIQFANDETDFGMGIEFGMNMFCFGDLALHKYIKCTLPVCYELLNRDYYSEIIREHLKNRKINIE